MPPAKATTTMQAPSQDCNYELTDAEHAAPEGPPLVVTTTQTRTAKYQPYYTTSLETPMFHKMLEPCGLPAMRPCLAALYRIRWMLARPLATPLLPRFLRVKSLYALHWTVGEVLLLVPLLIWLLMGYHYTFVGTPDVAESGEVASYAIFLTFLTANKSNSLFSFLFGIPFERMIPYHKVASFAAVILGMFHAHAAYLSDLDHGKYGYSPDLWSFLLDQSDESINFSGTCLLALIIGLVMLSGFGYIRRVMYNLWLCSHIVLAVAVLVALFAHDVSSAAFVAAWWGLDLLTRYAVMASCQYRAVATIRKITSKGTHEPAIEISIRKDAMTAFTYNAGQFVRIVIPKISIWEFHPVTISSAPHEDVITFHMRALGDWTQRLVDLAADDNDAGSAAVQVDIGIEGPYGALGVDMEDDQRYRMTLLVGGGIGITPCQSIGKQLVHQYHHAGRQLTSLKFIWVVRDMEMVEKMQPLGATHDFSIKNQTYQNNASVIRRSSQQEKPALIQVDIYRTRQDSKYSELEERNALPYNLYDGRPNLDAIFKDMKEHALQCGEQNVAVIGCGPAPLMEQLQEACREYSDSIVGCGSQPVVFFDLHLETFDF